MTQEQQNHVNMIASEFSRMMADKYEKGVKEHGGNLWDVSMEDMINMAIEEAIDEFVYLITLRSKIHGN